MAQVGPAGGVDPVRGSAHSTSRSGRSSTRNKDAELGSSLANSTNCANLRHGYNSVKQGYTAGKLPLPDDFFPVPQLSSKETKYLLGLAKHACKEVVYYSRQDDGPMKWLHLSSEDGVDVFQGVDSSSPQQDAKALTYLRGACKIHATIDELSDFFKLDTPEKLSGFTQTVGKDLLDQKTLLTLATPTPDNPKHYVAVKWTAAESPSKLARNRDFCYIECHDEFIDANTKRRGWVRSIHSIRLPFCPPLNRSHGLVRGSFYRSGYIFTESAEKGCVDAVHTLHVDIKGNAPNWLKILVMKRRIKNIAEVDRHFQLQRLTQGKLLGDLELPDKAAATRCQLCETRFGFFHRRRLCRKCGKVVCSPCGNEYLLNYAGLGPKKVRICLGCSESVVYGVSVPMMDAAGQIIEETHADAKKLEGSDIKPVYDESMIMLENRQLSLDEDEYYMEHEDATGIADIKEAKRMNKEFEDLLAKSSIEFTKQRREDAAQRRLDLNAKSLLEAHSASGETLPVETPPDMHGDLPPWEEAAQVREGDMDDDDELGLPPSRSEQMRKLMQHEEQRRREQIQRVNKLHQYASGNHSPEYFSTDSTDYEELRHDQPQRPRAHGITRIESEESLRLSSAWGDDYHAGVERPGVLTNFHSNGSGRSSSSAKGRGVTASDLSAGSHRSRSRSASHGASPSSPTNRDYRYANGGIPRRRSRHDSNEDEPSSEDQQRRTQQYFEARNARLTLMSGRRLKDDDFVAHDSVERLFEYERPMAMRFRSSGIGAGSDPPVRRHLTGSELESPYTSLSDSHLAGAFTTRRRHRSDDLEDRDDEAFRMAMSAMRLYEEERGPGLKVAEETKRAALAKMMEVDAREIERSHSNDSMPYSRGTISDTRRLHHEVGIPPPLRLTVSDDRPPSFYGSPLQVFSQEDVTPRRQRRPAASKYSREVPRVDAYGPPLRTKREAKRKPKEEAHEYKDLSDLTSSAFQAFQMNSLGPRDAPKLPVDVVESSEDSRRHDGYQQGDDQGPASSAQYQRESTSTTHVQLKSDTSGARSRTAHAADSSADGTEVPNIVSRPNSMYGVADSDTFSDLDLIDLPHLMRKSDAERGSRNSFADLQHWAEDGASQADAERSGIEYAPEPRLSDLLSPLHLEDVQHVDGDDSESQSSNSSSQIDWQGSLPNRFPPAQGGATDSESSFIRAYSIGQKGENEYQDEAESISGFSDSPFATNGLSESMVTQNDDQPPLRNRQPPSLSELLSEYCDSERSSLPSYLEFGGSQPELEPEYLAAIENASNDNTFPMEGGRREHVRRRSSIPSELEAMTSRELYL